EAHLKPTRASSRSILGRAGVVQNKLQPPKTQSTWRLERIHPAVAPNTLETVYSGEDLSPDEEAQYATHPLVAQDLLKSIPRMESIAWMIAHQFEPLPTEWDTGDREMADTRLGAQILKAAIIFDGFLRKRHSRVEAAHFLTRRFAGLNPKIIEALMELEPEVAGEGTRTAGVADLHAGMVLQQEVRTKEGVLVAAKGQEVTAPLLIKLQSFWKKSAIPDSVSVSSKFQGGCSGSPQEGLGAEEVSGASNQV
ncbi:MAG: HD domain-containing phosphohydrolase, partial [Terriglobia bacterium]